MVLVVVVEAETADHAFVVAGVVEAEIGDGLRLVCGALVVVKILFHLYFFD